MDRSRIILSADLAELTGPGSEARRERAATALERSLAFVDAEGSELSRLRARVLLQVRKPAEAVAALGELQTEDGAFRMLPDRCFPQLVDGPGAQDADGEIAATLEALAVLGSLRALRADYVDRTVDFLIAAQQADGSWAPARDSDSDTRLFTTGMIGGFLGRTRSVRPEVLAAAGRYIEAEWAPERVEGGAWTAVTAFAHFFTNVHHELADEALQWCGRELERGFRTHQFDAVATLRVLLYCDAAALPGLKLETEELLDLLLSQQNEDGGFWTSCLGRASAAESRVSATLDAMRATLALCGNLSED